MPISNVSGVSAEFGKIAGQEGAIGAKFFMKAFKLPGVQATFPNFKGKDVSEGDLAAHGATVINYMKDKIASESADANIADYVSSHKAKKDVTLDMLKASKGLLVETFTEAGMDSAVMEKFVGEFVDDVSQKW